MREGWEYKKLGEVAQVVSGATPKTNVDEFWGEGHYWVTPAELNDNIVYVERTERQITDFALLKTKLQLLPKGTVLLSSRAPIGKVAICGVDMYCNQGFKNCICSDAIYNKYLFYFLKGKKEYLNSLGRGAIFKEISKSIVEKVIIPLPPMQEQREISDELDQVNDLIRLKKEQLKEYDNLAQSIFYDMFGDPVENEKGWEVKKLKDISKVKIGPFGSLLHVEDYVEGGRPVINPVHMNGGRIVADKNFSVSEEKYKELSSYVLKENDIVFGRRGDIGRCALVSENEDGFICGTGSLFVRFDIEVDTTYILRMLLTNSIKSILISKAKGATMLNINCGIVESLQVPLPPLPLQQEFSSRIELIEKLKAEVTKTITDLETLLASRMQYWFE